MTGPDGVPSARELEAPNPTTANAGTPDFPTPHAAARIAAFLADHLFWSAFWDERHRVWRVAEDDPDSDLYAESRDAAAVIRYMAGHS